MSKRSERYNDSPTLKRDDESGKMKATKKPSEDAKKSSEESAGTAGTPQHEVPMQELEHKHSKERMELFHKHEKEHLDLRHKSIKESTTSGEGDGKEKINKADGGSN